VVSAYDRGGMRAARQRIVQKVLIASREPEEEDEAPLTLRGEAVAEVLQSAAARLDDPPADPGDESSSASGTTKV